MVERSPDVPLPEWTEPRRCPFCGTALCDGGPGFIDHLDASAPCQAGFESWRERVANDIGGEWIS